MQARAIWDHSLGLLNTPANVASQSVIESLISKRISSDLPGDLQVKMAKGIIQ